MKSNIRKGLFLLLCAVLLTGCGENLQLVRGLVTELQTGGGGLTAVVIQASNGEEIGILLTGETRPYPPALQPDVEITAECTRGKKTLTTDSGARITAYEARYIRILGQLERGALTLQDGTSIDVIEDAAAADRTYRLADGTELLRVRSPCGPADTHVAGVEGFDDLSEAAQKQVLAYYEQRGLLYSELEELEKAYSLYQELKADFRPGLVEQSVVPTASSGRVMYFLTSVMLPTGHENGNVAYEIRLGDAFDRETGAYIDTWDLFSVPKDKVIQALLELGAPKDPALRAEAEAAPWDGHIVFFPDSLSVEFWPPLISGQERCDGMYVDLDPGVRALMRDWAVPKSRT